MGAYKRKKSFKYHLPGPVAGDFLCLQNDDASHRNVIHLEAPLADIAVEREAEVCVVCLQKYLEELLKKGVIS